MLAGCSFERSFLEQGDSVRLRGKTQRHAVEAFESAVDKGLQE